MCKIVAYMRISTEEGRGKQKFTRQEQAIERWQKENNVKQQIEEYTKMMQVVSHLIAPHGKNWKMI